MTETIPSDFPDGQKTSPEPQATEQQVELNAQARRSVFNFPKKKRALTILLVGETGNGKTAFLSLLLNLLQGNGPFELQEEHHSDAESGLSRSQSQTTEATPYNLLTAEGVEFQIIDTPGIADTRGLGEDNKHKEKIYKVMKKHVKTIDGIILIINGRNERLNATTGYTLETLATFFPRSIKDNIGIVFTNVCTDERGLNFQMESLPSDLQAAKYWCLDNPLSLYKNYLPTARQLTESQREKSKQAKNLQADYNNTVERLDNWLEWLDEREAMPTNTIIELYHKSTEIESRLFGTTLAIENLTRLRKELQGIIRDLEAVEAKQMSLSEIQQREPPKIWELVETADYNTICLSSNCHNNCHLQCNLQFYDPIDLGGWCKVFKTLGVPNRLIPFRSDSKVKCSKCNHGAAEHRNYRRLYEERPSKIYQDAVEELQDVKISGENLKKAKNRIEREIEKVEQSIEESKQDIPRLVDEMNNVSLSPNYAGYIRSAIRLFELRKKQLESSPDTDEDLSVIDKGITAFKGHLDLLKGSKVSRAALSSYKLVERAFRLE